MGLLLNHLMSSHFLMVKEEPTVTICAIAKIGFSCCLPGDAIFWAVTSSRGKEGTKVPFDSDVWAAGGTQEFLGRETSN